jgi:hypothetical protein
MNKQRVRHIPTFNELSTQEKRYTETTYAQSIDPHQDRNYTAVCLLVSDSPSSTHQNLNILWVQEHDFFVDLTLRINTWRSLRKIAGIEMGPSDGLGGWGGRDAAGRIRQWQELRWMPAIPTQQPQRVPRPQQHQQRTPPQP